MLLDQIPELKHDSALRHTVGVLNQPGSGVFTIGCDSIFPTAQMENKEQSLHRCEGYIEFCVNSHSFIKDAKNYFAMFFHFNKLLHKGTQRPLQELEQWQERLRFTWETEGVDFTEAHGAQGFTCSVTVDTAFMTGADLAYTYYEAGMWLLTSLANCPAHDDPIFPMEA